MASLESPAGGPRDNRIRGLILDEYRRQDIKLRKITHAPYPPGMVPLGNNEELQQRRLEQLAQRGLSPVEFDRLEAGRSRRWL